MIDIFNEAELRQSLYEKYLQEGIIKKAGRNDHENDRSGEVDHKKIYDYFIVSTEPLIEAAALNGLVQGETHETPLHLNSLPDKSILKVQTQVGSRYFVKEIGPLITGRLKHEVPSKNPFFVRMVLPQEKEKLMNVDGYVITSFNTLLPK